MIPVEHVCYIESHHYQIVKCIPCCGPSECIFILIFYEEEQKYNYYYDFFFTFDADNIVKNCKPRPLEEAQKLFPDYNLNESNYGF